MSEDASKTLTEIIPGIYFIPGITNVGVITNTKNSITEIYLVDAGRTEEHGKTVLNTITDYFSKQNKNFSIKAIFNTHAHADHCGADSYIQNQTNCEIFLSSFERGILENTLLQSSILWGGYPPHELQNSLYKPYSVENTKVFDFSQSIKVLPPHAKNNNDFYTISFIDLPGHYFGDTGILITTNENQKILFAGDAISNREELGKYWIQFMIQPDKFIETLDKICKIEKLICCIPSHGKCIKDDLNETAELCTIAVYSTRQSILKSLEGKSLTTEQIIKEVAEKNNISMGFGQYNLVSTTIRSHLSSMHDKGLLKMKPSKNQIFWEIL